MSGTARGRVGGYHPAVTPLLLVGAGLVALVAGVLTLRSFGSSYRIGRLLASAPKVGVAEATAIAETGPPRYVRVDGRIDAEDPFEDAAHRPLVFRRTRLEAQAGRGWSRFEDSREAVPFEIRDGLERIEVDHDALGDGLVVVRRESIGVAGDLADRAPETLPPETPVRAVIEQVSSVEHAVVLGVPVAAVSAGGPARMTAGLGRPLVLTTLEPVEAMRILAGGNRRARVVAICFAVGLALIVAGLIWAGIGALLPAIIPVAMAASPTPAAGGDPRSSGEGPGLVGEPGVALLAVVLIAVAAIAATTVYIRLTEPPKDRRKR